MRGQNQRRRSPSGYPRQQARGHAEKLAPLCEILRSESFHWRAEFRQSGIDRLRVVGGGLNQQIDIFRGARLRVERYGVAPHDKVLNAMGVEDGQEFVEVLEHRGPCPSLRTLPG